MEPAACFKDEEVFTDIFPISPVFLHITVFSIKDFTFLDCDLFQREEALLNDLDVTGQAFEDMQEQNTRLLQQLREKDDANFKLMSEVNIGRSLMIG